MQDQPKQERTKSRPMNRTLGAGQVPPPTHQFKHEHLHQAIVDMNGVIDRAYQLLANIQGNPQDEKADPAREEAPPLGLFLVEAPNIVQDKNVRILELLDQIRQEVLG